jgi:pilus assembly protein Flp/PilA
MKLSVLKQFLREEEGATMIEYALLAALISVVAIIAITGAGLGVKATFKEVCEKLKAAVAGGMACE